MGPRLPFSFVAPSGRDRRRGVLAQIVALVGVIVIASLGLGLGFGFAAAAPPTTAEGEGPPASLLAGEDLGQADAGQGTKPAAAASAAAVEQLRDRTRKIRALIAGDLDPAVDVAELFEISLVDPDLGEGGDELRQLLLSIHEARVALELRAQREAERERANKRRPKTPVAEVPLVEVPEPAPAGPEADPLTRARVDLARAYWSFFTLPEAQRLQRLRDHEARRIEIAEAREAEARARARVEVLTLAATQLAALIDGELDLGVDPRPLLRLDLSAAEEIGREDRLARVFADEAAPDGPSEAQTDEEAHAGDAPPDEADVGPNGAPPTPAPDGAELARSEIGEALDASLAAELAAAEAALDAQRMRLLALTPAQRRALLDAHAARQRADEDASAAAQLLAADEEAVAAVEEELTEAEDKAAAAKREREQAEAAATQARSEALRLIAGERARLLGVKEAHALYEVELAKRRKDTLAAHEVALEWNRRVAELRAGPPGASREAAADALYADLREALADARGRLRETLTTIASGETGVEPVGAPLSGLPQDVDRSDLSTLRTELEVSEMAQLDHEREVVWAAADTGRDDIVMLNRARLELLEISSDDLRARMTGFGADGVEQVRREVAQIGLELRYRAVALPRLGRGLLERFELAPLPMVFAIIKIAFALLLFRYWRKRAADTLDHWRDEIHGRERGNAQVNEALALVLWYVDRVRKPVEILLLAWVVFRVVLADNGLLELDAVWLVVLWLSVGYAVILFIDAVAAHENMVYGRGSSATAQLRIRSLRLVGLTVVLTGLVLSLTSATVGEGAIHQWVSDLVWFAAIPILLQLIRWWREHAFVRIQDDPEIPDGRLVRWIRAHTDGLASFLAATVAGGYLFGRGISRWLLHRAAALESTRRLLAWMFRREVARQAHARREAEEQPVVGLDADDAVHFDPALDAELDELGEVLGAVGETLLSEITQLKVTRRGTLSAVIGERGSGKTTMLRRLALALEEQAEDYVHDGHETEKAEAAEGDRHAEYGRLTVRQIQCPPGGFGQLRKAIAESIGLSRNASEAEVIAALSEQTPLVFIIDDVHRLVRPAIGGLAGLDRFADFAREVSGDASWIASIDAAAWQYVSRARGERVFFDQVLKLGRWDEHQIGALLRARNEAARIRPNFEEIVIPRQFDVATVGGVDANRAADPTSPANQIANERERAELGFYRILWDYAKGNPAVALHFWRESLFVVDSSGEEQIKVRLFQDPPGSSLDEVGPTLHFVLRGVVQLEIASREDLVACTQLPPADVADALRFALTRGWVEHVGKRGDRFRVTWHWYRAVTDMLRRQHLLEM